MLQGQPRQRGRGKHKTLPMSSLLALPMGAECVLETMQFLVVGFYF